MSSVMFGSSKSIDRKSIRLNSSHGSISYAVFCLKKKKKINKYRDNITTHLSLFLSYFFFFFSWLRRSPLFTLFPYTTLFRSVFGAVGRVQARIVIRFRSVGTRIIVSVEPIEN